MSEYGAPASPDTATAFDLSTLPSHRIGVYENALPVELCDDLIALFDVSHACGITHRFNEGYRRCTIANLPHGEMSCGKVLCDKFIEIVRGKFNEYAKQSNVLQNCKGIEIPSIILYEPAESPELFAIHADNWDGDSSSRQVSVIAYLNDVEQGGETTFPQLGVRVPPKTGTLILFPAFFTHMHQAEPPVSESKYCVVTWLHFPGGKYGTFPF
jgi:hypothetical protein